MKARQAVLVALAVAVAVTLTSFVAAGPDPAKQRVAPAALEATRGPCPGVCRNKRFVLRDAQTIDHQRR